MKVKELGLILIIISIPLSVFSIFILNYMEMFYVSLGILVIGLSSFSIDDNNILPYTLRKMIESSVLNIEALLEEYNTLGKAIYTEKDDRNIAFIPYKEDENYYYLVDYIKKIPLRVSNDLGIIIFPPFHKVEYNYKVSDESWINSIIVDDLNLASNVKILKENNLITVNINEPKGRYLNIPRYYKCLGSLETSITLSALSTYYRKPVRLIEEIKSDQGIIVRAEVIKIE
ncbi:MAG: hypothetical protein RXN79_01780 [Candidatus Nanopusillus sp.]|jgi:hypothetical protein